MLFLRGLFFFIDKIQYLCTLFGVSYKKVKKI